MKVVLVAYNWEANTSLAAWNLVNCAKQDPVVEQSATFDVYCAATPKSQAAEDIELSRVLDWIGQQTPSILGFSCYIWNIRFSNRVAQAVKELWPQITIVYGGQQIRGFYLQQVFERERCVDICVVGEGEFTFQRLLRSIVSGDPALSTIPGLAYYATDEAPNVWLPFSQALTSIPHDYRFRTSGESTQVADLTLIPSPYLGATLPRGSAFLYEASRGCPYQCSFCIWGEAKGVREYPMDRVEAELEAILAAHPSHIMFCDGTFNMRKNRAVAILSILVKHLKSGAVQPFSLLLELKLEIIDEALVATLDELLSLNPLVTVEFGLQSASQAAAKLMRRPFRDSAFRDAWARLTPRLRSSAILDCIYGLPGDGVQDFKDTVDFCFSLKPHRIQCFRLSVLPGSEFDRRSTELGLTYAREPNHMVHRSQTVDLAEMSDLESFGFAVADLYHFHGYSIRCALAALRRMEAFSGLVSEFIRWAGRERIIGSSYDGNRPEGRWRAINLSDQYRAFFRSYMIPRMELSAIQMEAFNCLLEYETAMGAIAISFNQENRQPSSEILLFDFDIPAFIRQLRLGVANITIDGLVKRRSAVAVTAKSGGEGTRIPVSYRLPYRVAHSLRHGETIDAPETLQKLVDMGIVTPRGVYTQGFGVHG